MAKIGYDKLALMFMMGSKGVSLLQQSAQSEINASTGAYNASLLRSKSNVAEVQQQWAYHNMKVIKQQGEVKKRQLTKEYERTASDIRTVKGISSTSPTILAIIEESAQEYLYDMALTDWDTELQVTGEERTAWSKGIEALQYENEADYQEKLQQMQSSQSKYNKYSSLLTGGAKIAGVMAGMQTPTASPYPGGAHSLHEMIM